MQISYLNVLFKFFSIHFDLCVGAASVLVCWFTFLMKIIYILYYFSPLTPGSKVSGYTLSVNIYCTYIRPVLFYDWPKPEYFNKTTAATHCLLLMLFYCEASVETNNIWETAKHVFYSAIIL